MELDPELAQLSIRLAEAAARNTATSVATRIKATKSAKREREAISDLEDIVQSLIEDRAELLQIAEAYKEQVARQAISETDIEYITSHLVPTFKELLQASGAAEDLDSIVDTLPALISAETVTILQLVGFNFKAAIGTPLTELVAAAIASKSPTTPARQAKAKQRR